MRIIIRDFVRLFREEPVILFIFCWFFCGMFMGTLATYSVLVLIPIMLNRIFRNNLVDKLFCFICLYSFTYAVFTYLNGFYSASGNVIFQFLYPPLFYLVGKWLVKMRSGSIYLMLFLMIGLMALSVFLDIAYDIREHQFINALRQVEREDGSLSTSATNMGMRFSLCVSSFGLIFCSVNDAKERVYKKAFIVLSVLGIISSVHLINRTGLTIAIASMFMLLLLNLKGVSKAKIFITLVGVVGFLIVYLPTLEVGSEIQDAYTARNESESFSGTTMAGDRGWRWERGIKDIFDQPLGYSSISERGTYAHNYWLDTVATSGTLPFVFLLIVTLLFLRKSWFLIRYMPRGLLKSIVICCNIGFFLTSMVEPTMEGFMEYVFLMFFFVGISVQIYEDICNGSFMNERFLN